MSHLQNRRYQWQILGLNLCGLKTKGKVTILFPSVLWLCCFGDRKNIQPIKTGPFISKGSLQKPGKDKIKQESANPESPENGHTSSDPGLAILRRSVKAPARFRAASISAAWLFPSTDASAQTSRENVSMFAQLHHTINTLLTCNQRMQVLNLKTIKTMQYFIIHNYA